MTKLRLFVAVEISEDARRAVKALVSEYVTLASGIRWVRPVSLHLTLKFLGEVEDHRVPELKIALENSTNGLSPFQYVLSGLGAFPDFRRARVLWVGVQDTSGLLIRLQENVERQFARIGFPREKREFHPHLTIARVKDSRKIAPVVAKFQDQEFGSYQVKVDRVLLMKSDLQPTGAKYTPLHSATIC